MKSVLVLTDPSRGARCDRDAAPSIRPRCGSFVGSEETEDPGRLDGGEIRARVRERDGAWHPLRLAPPLSSASPRRAPRRDGGSNELDNLELLCSRWHGRDGQCG